MQLEIGIDKGGIMEETKQDNGMARKTIYLNHKHWLILKAKMSLKGKSVSAWMRDKIAEEIAS